jgi:hypothetical protein
MTLAEGITLGPYEIISPLGTGGTVSAPLFLPNDVSALSEARP